MIHSHHKVVLFITQYKYYFVVNATGINTDSFAL
jgi:hypothetical protein